MNDDEFNNVQGESYMYIILFILRSYIPILVLGFSLWFISKFGHCSRDSEDRI